MWPFSKKNEGNDGVDAGTGESASTPSTSPVPNADPYDAGSQEPSSVPETASAYDPVNGDFGPFDGDKVDYSTFDYSDFAKSGLDLGSLRVPVPHNGEVQVEMGPKGPQMIHILTPFGRLTPVALAAPRSGRQWEENIPEITKGMSADGLEVRQGQSLWGTELVGTMKAGTMRVVGVDGPRWMLRMTLAGPADKADQLAELAYEVISRTFVYRGDDPLPAGQALPVTIPAAMAEELRKVVEQRQKDAAKAKPEDGE
ncbi:MAG: DUF3710 domain-containing protein [Corynebacterium sp.]|uniref:DUF3710 domain-containing protein n=1 Tax=Corynebacterium sp. TaxID=1720 RepID=UPI003F01367B